MSCLAGRYLAWGVLPFVPSHTSWMRMSPATEIARQHFQPPLASKLLLLCVFPPGGGHPDTPCRGHRSPSLSHRLPAGRPDRVPRPTTKARTSTRFDQRRNAPTSCVPAEVLFVKGRPPPTVNVPSGLWSSPVRCGPPTPVLLCRRRERRP